MEMSAEPAPSSSRLLIPDKSFRTNGCDCCQLAFAEVKWCRLSSVVLPAKSLTVASNSSHPRVGLSIFSAGNGTLVRVRASIPLGKIQNQTAEACFVCVSHGVWKKSHHRSAALHVSGAIPISKGQRVVTAFEGGAQEHCLRKKPLS